MKRAIHTLKIIALLCWPMVTYAGTVTLGQGMGALSLLDIVTVVVLSLFSGAVAMLQRMEREGVPAVPWRWITAHMGVALLAGVMAFFVCEAADMENWREALTIVVAAWGGARFIDAMTDRVLPRVKPGAGE